MPPSTNIEKPREETIAPSLLARLALWLGIYLLGFGFFLIMVVGYDQEFAGDPDISQHIGIVRFSALLLLFPFGLSTFWRLPWLEFGLFLSYATYLIHFIFTYRVKSGRVFVLLMLVLVVLVSCDVAGCSELVTPPMAK